jgi:hypothetical protein
MNTELSVQNSRGISSSYSDYGLCNVFTNLSIGSLLPWRIYPHMRRRQARRPCERCGSSAGLSPHCRPLGLRSGLCAAVSHASSRRSTLVNLPTFKKVVFVNSAPMSSFNLLKHIHIRYRRRESVCSGQCASRRRWPALGRVGTHPLGSPSWSMKIEIFKNEK